MADDPLENVSAADIARAVRAGETWRLREQGDDGSDLADVAPALSGGLNSGPATFVGYDARGFAIEHSSTGTPAYDEAGDVREPARKLRTGAL